MLIYATHSRSAFVVLKTGKRFLAKTLTTASNPLLRKYDIISTYKKVFKELIWMQ